MIRVKICGITRWEDARLACELGSSALGFNFYEKSPRSIAPARAWDIIRRLPPFVAPVGVFVNWKPTAVIALAKSLRLAAVQLHGDEDSETVAACARQFPVIKAFRAGPHFSLNQLKEFSMASGFLFDAAASGNSISQFGGTGERSDWCAAREAARRHCVILAGGLTADNAAEAVQFVRPYAVDVASGVESSPSVKDSAKLRAFMTAVSSV